MLFPQRLKQSIFDKEFENVVKLYKKLHINLPFADAIAQISLQAKFLKESMLKKRRLEDHEILTLMEENSALKDPDNFSIPCTIDNIIFLMLSVI